MRILLVDDDPTFGRVMMMTAHQMGIDLKFLVSAKEAYKITESNFDIAILDFYLGEVNGVQLANYFENHLDPKTLLLTSSTSHPQFENWPHTVKGFIEKKVGGEKYPRYRCTHPSSFVMQSSFTL